MRSSSRRGRPDDGLPADGRPELGRPELGRPELGRPDSDLEEVVPGRDDVRFAGPRRSLASRPVTVRPLDGRPLAGLDEEDFFAAPGLPLDGRPELGRAEPPRPAPPRFDGRLEPPREELEFERPLERPPERDDELLPAGIAAPKYFGESDRYLIVVCSLYGNENFSKFRNVLLT